MARFKSGNFSAQQAREKGFLERFSFPNLAQICQIAGAAIQ
jgi:hypothetical protein